MADGNTEQAAGTGTNDAGGQAPAPVPYERFQAVNARLQTAETTARELTGIRDQHTAAERAWAEERAVLKLGITDDECVATAKFLHSRLPEQGRPEFSAWLTDLKNDPSKAPKPLSAWSWFAPPAANANAGAAGGANAAGAGAQGTAAGAAAAGTEKAAEKAADKSTPNGTGVVAGTTTTTATGSGLSAEQIKAIVDRAKVTGDWSEYEAHRTALGMKRG